MRYFIKLGLLLCSIYVQGQVDTFSLDNNQQNGDNNPTPVVVIDARQKYVYNDNKDTLFFADMSFGYCIYQPLEIVGEIQVDQKGAKEVVFHRTCYQTSVFYESSYSRASSGFQHQYEVWNVDTKECLFKVATYYKGTYKDELIQKTRFKQYKKGKFFYQCTFHIEENGNIHLQKMRGKNKASIEKKEGIYVFKNGNYELMP